MEQRRLGNKRVEQASPQPAWPPNEIMVMIFELLDLNTLLKCRLVSKWFNDLAKMVRVTSLSVSRSASDHYELWSNHVVFTNDNLLGTRTLLQAPRSIHLLRTEFMRGILSKIRKLFMFGVRGDQSEWVEFLRRIGGLDDLQHLLICSLNMPSDQQLILPSVKILEINWCSRTLRLKAPNLMKLAWYPSLTQLEFDVTPNITELALSGDDLLDFVRYLQSKEVAAYKNVEQVHLRNRSYYSEVTVNSFITESMRMMPNLKVIHFDYDPHYKHQLVSHLMSIKKASRPNLTFDGFLFTGQDDLSPIIDDFTVDFRTKNSRLVAAHYEKLVGIVTWMNGLNYSELIDRFGTLPLDFTTRFARIQFLSVDRAVKKKSDFVEFIRRCPMLYRLEIKNSSSIDQAFYDDLHVHCGYIEELVIEEDDPKSPLDSAFITKHQQLSEYRINQPVAIELIELVFKNSERFKHVHFMLGGKEIEFYSNGSSLIIGGKIVNTSNKFNYLKKILELASSK